MSVAGKTIKGDGFIFRVTGEPVVIATMEDGLFDVSPLVTPTHEPTATIQEQFEAFHANNPWVLSALEAMAADWLAAGHSRVGVKQLWEVIRYSYGRTVGDTFKANNNYTSRYSRLMVERNPAWADAIELRELRAA